jgi:sugar phosphate isomerase/epimerase
LERSSIRSLFASHELEIASLAGYASFAGLDESEADQNLQLMNRTVDLAYDLGAPYVRAFLGTKGNGQLTSYGKEALNQCAQYAKKSGIGILLEIHDSFDSGKEARQLLDTMQEEALHILWDVSHSFDSGETAEQTVSILQGEIRHVHLTDLDTSRRPCQIGKGILPIAAAVLALETNGYKGYYSYEWEKTWISSLEEPEIVFPQFIEFMKARNTFSSKASVL